MRLLHLDPDRRMSAAMALQNPLFTDNPVHMSQLRHLPTVLEPGVDYHEFQSKKRRRASKGKAKASGKASSSSRGRAASGAGGGSTTASECGRVSPGDPRLCTELTTRTPCPRRCVVPQVATGVSQRRA